jgi:hypothetical protein
MRSSSLIERVMTQHDARSRNFQMSFGRFGGFGAGVLAVLSGIVVIALAVLFSALFLGLLVAIAIGVAVRAWLSGRKVERPGGQKVIDAEYTVVETRAPPDPRSKP